MVGNTPPQPSDPDRALRHGYARLRRYSLTLCASLVTNPANLGGLCRLAEVFRLESLVLSHLAIAQDPAFRRTAVSAHHWQPLAECPVNDLPIWFDRQHQRGYTVVALDVDGRSEAISACTFPTQTILLLGRELTGIPDALLKQCDRMITIPQYGLVESLNVQHAGAIAIYEYLRQHAL